MKYEHIVYVDKINDKYFLRIDRLFENGNRAFMSEFEIPLTGGQISSEAELWDEFERLGAILGKSICIDSKDLRQAMGIDEE